MCRAACNVSMQLADQFGGIGKLASFAHPQEKIDAQRLPVKVAGKIDQVNFDLALLFAEGRIGADVGGRGPASAGVLARAA